MAQDGGLSAPAFPVETPTWTQGKEGRTSAGAVHGRDRECRVIGAFVTGLDLTTLVVSGLSGIGKSATVLAALDRIGAYGSAVRVVRSCSSRPYAQDLAGGRRLDLSEWVVPDGQELELDVAGLLAAVVTDVTVTATVPGVLFVDDIEVLSPGRAAWLQRLGDLAYERGWRVIAAARYVPEGTLPDDVEVLPLQPLDEAALHQVLSAELDLPVAADVVSRLRWWSSGNPRLAVELAGALSPAQLGGGTAWAGPDGVGPAGRRAYRVLLDHLGATEVSVLAKARVERWDPTRAPGRDDNAGAAEPVASSVAGLPEAARAQRLAQAHPLVVLLCREQADESPGAAVRDDSGDAAGLAGVVEAVLDGLHLEDLAGLPAAGVTPRATAGVVGIALLTGTTWVRGDTGSRFLNLVSPEWTDHLWWRDPAGAGAAARAAGTRVTRALIELESTGRLADPRGLRADLDTLRQVPDPHWVGLSLRVRGHLLLGDSIGARTLLGDPSAATSGRTVAEIVARGLAGAMVAMVEGRPAEVGAHLDLVVGLRPGAERWLPVRGLRAAAAAMLEGRAPAGDLLPAGAWSTRALGEYALDLGAARLAVGHVMAAAELMTIGIERCAWPYRGRAHARADMVEAVLAADGAIGPQARLIDPPVPPDERADGDAAAAHLRMLAVLRHGDPESVAAETWLAAASPSVSPWQRLRSLVAYARHCLARNDRATSQRALREARSLASLAGVPGWYAAIDALLVVDTPAGPGWNRLNEDEREFVRLALQGFTNAQIAATAYVSVRTVANRLRQIYAVLGVRDRRDLVARAQADPPGWLENHT